MDPQHYVLESPQQERSQPTSPLDLDCYSPASIPEGADHTSVDNPDTKTLKKQLDKKLCALRRVLFFDLLSLADAISSQ